MRSRKAISYQLLGTIREKHPETVVILHSGHTEYAHHIESWRANAFVEKRTNLDVLIKTIQRQLALHEGEVA